MSVVTDITFPARLLRLEENPAGLADMECAIAVPWLHGTHVYRSPVRLNTKSDPRVDNVVIVARVSGMDQPDRYTIEIAGIDTRTLGVHRRAFGNASIGKRVSRDGSDEPSCDLPAVEVVVLEISQGPPLLGVSVDNLEQCGHGEPLVAVHELIEHDYSVTVATNISIVAHVRGDLPAPFIELTTFFPA